MLNIFNYLDYRLYLKDYYSSKKQLNQGFSYKIFAEKAGFKDKSCVFSAISGKRNLNATGVLKISKMIGHTAAEADYFNALVMFNQTIELNEKKLFFDKLCSIKERGAKRVSRVQALRKEQFEFYSRWYNVAIRSLIEMYEFKGDYKWLARMVRPSISQKKARESVALLLKLGLIERQKNGVYVVPDKVLSTGVDVLGFAVQHFHMECADLAKKALVQIDSGERNVSSLTLGISESGYDQICEELETFQSRVMSIAENDKAANKVYQFNFHLFPTSVDDKENLRAS